MITRAGIFSTLLFTTSVCLFAEDHAPEVKMLQPGVQLSLVAEHPDLVTPTGVDVDESGNIWVVASHTHFPPEDYKGPKNDEILVFDQNGNRSVFHNATHHTMDLELGQDGWVYLAERSRVLRIKDSTGDGKADLSEDIAVLDTKTVYPHNGVAGLAWDLNGDLIFCLGENFNADWTLTGTDKKQFKGNSEGGVFRIKADGTGLSRIARGVWNPFGICVRPNGEIFTVDNDPGELPPCRLLQVVPRADFGFQRQYGSESYHPFVCWNGELRGTLPMVHPVGEAPCGVAAFGQGVLSPSWGDHHVCFYRLTPNGASYSAKPINLLKGSRYFRPACIAVNKSENREGIRSWYLTDWVDGSYNVHGYGRLWKLEINLAEATWLGPLELEPQTEAAQLANQLRSGKHAFSIEQLIETSKDKDAYLAQAALVALLLKAPQWTVKDFELRSTAEQLQMLIALRIAAQADEQSIKLKQWIPYFLKSDEQAIQFETLRLIADHSLNEYLPAVENILARSELDYKLFEAAMATWNTLKEKPELGFRNTEMLLKRVQDKSSSPQLRAFALRLLPARKHGAKGIKVDKSTSFPEGLTLELLNDLLEVGDVELSLEVVRTLAGNPQVGQEMLVSIINDKNQATPVQVEAIAGLAVVSSNHIDLLLKQLKNDQHEIREEALRSLRGANLTNEQKSTISEFGKTYPNSVDLTSAILTPESLSQGRPALTDTAAWAAKLKAVPGQANLNTGRRIFHHANLANCSTCHRHNGRGNTVGPDLSTVNRRNDSNWILEAILQPSLDMSPEYQPRLILLENGQTYTGIRLQSYTSEAIRDQNGQKRVFNRSDVEFIKDLDTSLMPNGLVHMLTDRELRDLIAFLNSSEK